MTKEQYSLLMKAVKSWDIYEIRQFIKQGFDLDSGGAVEHGRPKLNAELLNAYIFNADSDSDSNSDSSSDSDSDSSL